MNKNTSDSMYRKSLLKGSKAKNGLIEEHGGVLDYNQVIQVTGWNKAVISNHLKSKKILSIKFGDETKFPAFQFDQQGMIKGLDRVINALLLQTNDFWSAFVFLLNGNDFLPYENPSTPLDAIKLGDVDLVLDLIERRYDQSGR